MKLNEILLNTPPTNGQLKNGRTHDRDEMGDEHVSSGGYATPLRPDAFDLSDGEKMDLIEGHFAEIMRTLGLDLTDDSLRGTPRRVAKMYVQEIFSGLNPANKPKATLFENAYRYDEMLVEKDITFFSNCEHHFVPIFGRAHVGYISNGKVIGLSKINRIVQYYAKRPQVQERMNVQILNEMREALQTEDVAVLLDAKHMCVSSRGIQDNSSTTVTAQYGGRFRDEDVKQEFLKHVYQSTAR
ncbi:MAG: GTP cyclohydrolase I FolE [Catalinimonas sp.]